jgi:hypothetical protein
METIHMPTLPVLARTLPLSTLVLATLFAFVAVDIAETQERRDNSNETSQHRSRNYGVGGTSWTLSDVWGEPEMPEPSKEYPGFNHPPGGFNLNGPPNQSPYPN